MNSIAFQCGGGYNVIFKGDKMKFIGLLSIVFGVILLLLRKRLLDYIEKMNSRNKVPVSSEVVARRLLVGTMFLIVVGFVILLK